MSKKKKIAEKDDKQAKLIENKIEGTNSMSQFNHRWIDKGRIFKKVATKKPIKLKNNTSTHQVLKEFENIQNDNKVAHGIAVNANLEDTRKQSIVLRNENARLKKKIKKMRIKEDHLVDKHKIEKMTVETLEE